MTPDESIARLDEIRNEALAALSGAESTAALGDLRIIHLGRKSAHARIVATLGVLKEEQRKKVGRVANEVRSAIEAAIETKAAELERVEGGQRVADESIDVTLPGRRPERGRLHPITRVMDEIVDVFVGLGFRVAEGPEVETDYYNFEALNIPKDHAARTMHDTFYLSPGDPDSPIFRTHTSPVQIRLMESAPPPVYVVVPGRCARRDVPDPKRSPVFHQIEGLAVDEGISFSDMKGTLEAFAKAMFGERQRIRLNPTYFPFTEPSAEVSVLCFVCGGEGCSTCRGEGWIELLGAGMVHPNVFAAVGYPRETTGFAFGMGVERVAMARYGIPDIRWLFENDLRFLGAV